MESYYHPCRSTELGFNCKFCHHTFWVRGKLNDHVLARHDDLISDTFLICNVCTSPFISKVMKINKKSLKIYDSSDCLLKDCTQATSLVQASRPVRVRNARLSMPTLPNSIHKSAIDAKSHGRMSCGS